MSGKARPSLMRKTLGNVMLSDLSVTDKECIATVFNRYSERVEIVKCKDCKYLMFSDCYGECAQTHMGIVSPNDFCSYGERKDGVEK